MLSHPKINKRKKLVCSPKSTPKTRRFLVSCRTITLRKDKFDEREDDFYEALYTQSQAQFATYVQTGTVVNNYAHIFDLLIRLRQVSMPFLQAALSCCNAVASRRHTSHVLALLQ